MHKSNEKLQISLKMVEDKIFHGCFYHNWNGTRKHIDFERGEKCLKSTNNPYWKNDVKEKYLIKLKAHTRLYAEKLK